MSRGDARSYGADRRDRSAGRDDARPYRSGRPERPAGGRDDTRPYRERTDDRRTDSGRGDDSRPYRSSRPAVSGHGDDSRPHRTNRPAGTGRGGARPYRGDRPERSGGRDEARPYRGDRPERTAGRYEARPYSGERPERAAGRDEARSFRGDRPEGRDGAQPYRGGRPAGGGRDERSYGRPAGGGGSRPSRGAESSTGRAGSGPDRGGAGGESRAFRAERPERRAVGGSRRPGPGIEAPEDVDPRDLAPEVRSHLRSLSKLTADKVARHLIAAGRLVDDDPEAALQHARAARALGARVAVVREAAGETAYAAGEWAEAIAELRTARRMTGDDSALPLIADSERALGRPERALRLAQSDEAARLAPDARAELRIVEAGARRDLGQLDAALVTLEGGGLDRKKVEPWSARLWYAYADTLLALGRTDEARDWFAAAAAVDDQGTTDADERILALDGITVLEDDEDADEDDTLSTEDADDTDDDAEDPHDEDLSDETADGDDDEGISLSAEAADEGAAPADVIVSAEEAEDDLPDEDDVSDETDETVPPDEAGSSLEDVLSDESVHEAVREVGSSDEDVRRDVSSVEDVREDV